MTYTRVYTTNDPPLGSATAPDLDDAIRRLRVDFGERIVDITGGTSTADPIVPATNRLDVLRADIDALEADFIAAAATIPAMNASNNKIPRRSSSTAFADSSITDDGTDATFGGQLKAASHPYHRATKASAQSVATGSAVLYLLDTSEAGSRVITLASNQLVIPLDAKHTGLYVVNGWISVAGNINLTWVGGYLAKNDVASDQSRVKVYAGGVTGQKFQLSLSCLYNASGGDRFAIYIELIGSGNFNVDAGLAAAKIL